jgi:5-methylcytosine-specific restriction protein B
MSLEWQTIKDRIIKKIEDGTLPKVKYSKSKKNYFQIGLKNDNKTVDLKEIHFEITKTKQPNEYLFEIHFEEDDTTRYFHNDDLQEKINSSNKFEFFSWWIKNRNPENKSIRYKEKIKVSNDNDLDKLVEIIKETHSEFNKLLVKLYYSKKDGEFKGGGITMRKSQALNQILYGPPGTGKTYNTINKALEIIFSSKDMDNMREYKYFDDGIEKTISYHDALQKNDRKGLQAIFDYFRREQQIEFVTFHQSYGYEEFVEGIKPCD